MSDNFNDKDNEQKTEYSDISQEKMMIPVSEDDMPNGSESFISGFFTGALAAISVFLFVILVVLIVAGKKIGFINVSNRYDNVGKLDNIEEDINQINNKMKYIEKVVQKYHLMDVDESKMIEGIFRGMIDSLGDRYSVYLSAEELNELLTSSDGLYEGIGCMVTSNENGEVLVEEVIEGSGAMEAGVAVGDVLLEVNGVAINDQNSSDVVGQIRTSEDKMIKVKLKRAGSGIIEELSVEKKSVEYTSASGKMLEDGIAYISITGFENNTPKQFSEAVDKLLKEDPAGFIIDLRNNPGGTLESVSGIADRILPKGLLVYTQDKEGNEVDRVETSDTESIKEPIVVLVNESSASASEVLAGAIKDRNAGKLVGKKTFGKGIVQSVLSLSDGSAIKLTTSKYFTPGGHYIHGIGIEPDYEVELDVDKYKAGTDTQLEKAKQVIKQMKGN